MSDLSRYYDRQFRKGFTAQATDRGSTACSITVGAKLILIRANASAMCAFASPLLWVFKSFDSYANAFPLRKYEKRLRPSRSVCGCACTAGPITLMTKALTWPNLNGVSPPGVCNRGSKRITTPEYRLITRCSRVRTASIPGSVKGVNSFSFFASFERNRASTKESSRSARANESDTHCPSTEPSTLTTAGSVTVAPAVRGTK